MGSVSCLRIVQRVYGYKKFEKHRSRLCLHKLSGLLSFDIVSINQNCVHDLPDCVKSNIRLFADDCVIYRNIHSNCDHDIIQSDPNTLIHCAQPG